MGTTPVIGYQCVWGSDGGAVTVGEPAAGGVGLWGRDDWASVFWRLRCNVSTEASYNVWLMGAEDCP